ncbi:hypothetical protein IE53DRAFT_135345 [Violaceomyces palustris]|uniref:Uncharacterized protein n=1 Tax=Violaceomyces palustris TaxID=1673888 RepID=A0ACD0NUV8_9BASI|nr:hypothetical protein IE53DRAFT_135345 [Violaceomyces palustris]
MSHNLTRARWPALPAASRVAIFMLSVLFISTSSATNVSVTPAPQKSSAQSLSPTISPSYAGMGIEPSNLLSFTGTTSVNQLTFQLLSNLANYTGVPPHLRIGGNSGDNMIYNSSINSYYLQENPNASGQGNIKTDFYFFGPNYFRALDRMPKGTPITYGLNLAYTGADALDRISEQATAAFDLLSNVTVVGLEIGNEPDLYVQNSYRNYSWTATDFGNEWSTRAQHVYQQVLAPRNIGSNFFEPATTATTATKSGQQFRIPNLVETGVAVENGIYVAGWNQHDYYYYVGVSTYQLSLDLLLNLKQTSDQFREWANQAQQALVTGKPYYLREMGSVGPTGIQGISDTFGNTLWTLNFFLYAATVQVSSVQMHLTDNSYGSPWQPIVINGTRPHVRSSYYAWAAFDQVIGASCDKTIAPLTVANIPSTYQNRLSAYTIYKGDNIESIVMINTQPAYMATPSKPDVYFAVSLPTSFAGQTAYIAVLTADGADAKDNTTWNGISYERSGTGAPTVVSSIQNTTQVGQDGTLSVPVRDSQAVVVTIGRALGNEEVDQVRCGLLATSTPEGGENSANGTVTASPAPTFKSTTGFHKEGFHLSTGAIIAIAAGGGTFLLVLFLLSAWCCVRACKKSRRRKELGRGARAPVSMLAASQQESPLLRNDMEQGALTPKSASFYGPPSAPLGSKSATPRSSVHSPLGSQAVLQDGGQGHPRMPAVRGAGGGAPTGPTMRYAAMQPEYDETSNRSERSSARR